MGTHTHNNQQIKMLFVIDFPLFFFVQDFSTNLHQIRPTLHIYFWILDGNEEVTEEKIKLHWQTKTLRTKTQQFFQCNHTKMFSINFSDGRVLPIYLFLVFVGRKMTNEKKKKKRKKEALRRLFVGMETNTHTNLM